MRSDYYIFVANVLQSIEQEAQGDLFSARRILNRELEKYECVSSVRSKLDKLVRRAERKTSYRSMINLLKEVAGENE